MKKRKTARPRAPNPVDVHVGRRVRIRRVLNGLSQEELAADLGLTFQQLQKYESGANRISASRLYHLAELLDVPVGWFFAEYGEEQPFKPKRAILELVRHIGRMPPDVRSRFVGLAKSIADETGKETGQQQAPRRKRAA